MADQSEPTPEDIQSMETNGLLDPQRADQLRSAYGYEVPSRDQAPVDPMSKFDQKGLQGTSTGTPDPIASEHLDEMRKSSKENDLSLGEEKYPVPVDPSQKQSNLEGKPSTEVNHDDYFNPSQQQPQTQPKTGLPPLQLESLEPSIAAEKEANRQGALAGIEQAAKESEILKGQSREAERLADIQRLKNQTYEADKINYQQAYDDAAKEYKDTKIDDHRFWANKSTGETIGLIILSAIGGAASHWTGGKNLALDAIDKAVDRDIKNQELELNKKKGIMGDKMNLLGQLRQRHQDDEVSLNMAKSLGIAKTQAQLMEAGSQYKGPEIAAKVNELNAQLEQKRVQYDNQANAAMDQNATRKAVLEAKLNGGGMIASGNPVVDRIRTAYGSDKKVEQMALKQLEEKDKYDNGRSSISKTFNSLKTTSPIFNPYSADARAFDSGKELLAVEIGKTLAGRVSQTEINIITNKVLSPSSWASKDSWNAVQKEVETALGSHKPATNLIDHFYPSSGDQKKK